MEQWIHTSDSGRMICPKGNIYITAEHRAAVARGNAINRQKCLWKRLFWQLPLALVWPPPEALRLLYPTSGPPLRGDPGLGKFCPDGQVPPLFHTFVTPSTDSRQLPFIRQLSYNQRNLSLLYGSHVEPHHDAAPPMQFPRSRWVSPHSPPCIAHHPHLKAISQDSSVR